MINYILYTCLLALFQAWILPAALNASNAKWMLGNRDQDPNGSIKYLRAKRAYANLQESLPIFLVLSVLGIVLDINLESLMLYWLIARLVHVFAYVMGIALLRSASFIISAVILIMMAISLA